MTLPTFDPHKPPLEAYGDLRAVKRMFSWFLFVTQLALMAGIFIAVANQDHFTPVVLSVAIPFVFLAYFLIRRQQFEWAVIFIALTLIILLTFIATFGLGIHHIGNMAYALILLVASLVVQRKTLAFLTLVTIACVAWLVFGELYHFYIPQTFSQSVPGDFFTVTMIIVSTAIIVRALVERLFQNQYRIAKELEEQRIIKARLEEEIQQRLIAEKRAQQLNAELEQRVQERTNQFEHTRYQLEIFSYSVSHDLRSPLRAINGYATILLADYGRELPGAALQKLEVIRDNSIYMGQLVDGLLEFHSVKHQTLPQQLIEPTQIVHEVINALAKEIQTRQVEIVIGDLPSFYGNLGLIKKVYAKLIHNAVKFTRNCQQPHIEIGSQAQGEAIIYFVRDNGVGFDMQYYNKLFGVFQRLHRVGEFDGVGINLAIVQRIITVHGGSIWAESQPNQGATFFFTIGSGKDE